MTVVIAHDCVKRQQARKLNPQFRPIMREPVFEGLLHELEGEEISGFVSHFNLLDECLIGEKAGEYFGAMHEALRLGSQKVAAKKTELTGKPHQLGLGRLHSQRLSDMGQQVFSDGFVRVVLVTDLGNPGRPALGAAATATP